MQGVEERLLFKRKTCTYRRLHTKTAYSASETEKEADKKEQLKTEKTTIVASKRGLRKAKAKAREATTYLASMEKAMASDESD